MVMCGCVHAGGAAPLRRDALPLLAEDLADIPHRGLRVLGPHLIPLVVAVEHVGVQRPLEAGAALAAAALPLALALGLPLLLARRGRLLGRGRLSNRLLARLGRRLEPVEEGLDVLRLGAARRQVARREQGLDQLAIHLCDRRLLLGRLVVVHARELAQVALDFRLLAGTAEADAVQRLELVAASVQLVHLQLDILDVSQLCAGAGLDDKLGLLLDLGRHERLDRLGLALLTGGHDAAVRVGARAVRRVSLSSVGLSARPSGEARERPREA